MGKKKFDLSKLIGKEVVVNEVGTDGINGRVVRAKKYMVIMAYPYHVVGIRITDTGYSEQTSFSVGDLVVMGILQNDYRYRYWKSA